MGVPPTRFMRLALVDVPNPTNSAGLRFLKALVHLAPVTFSLVFYWVCLVPLFVLVQNSHCRYNEQNVMGICKTDGCYAKCKFFGQHNYCPSREILFDSSSIEEN